MLGPAGKKVLSQEMASQRRYVFFSLAQRRKGNGKFIEPVKQAAEKGSRGGGSLQIPTRSGNQPRGAVPVGVHRLQVAQNSQKAELRIGCQIVDAFEKDRSPFGRREAVEAWLRLGGPSPFPLTELLGSDELRLDGGAADADALPVGTMGQLVNGATSSFPVPLSPVIRMVRLDLAALRRYASSWCSTFEDAKNSWNIHELSASQASCSLVCMHFSPEITTGDRQGRNVRNSMFATFASRRFVSMHLRHLRVDRLFAPDPLLPC